MQIYTEVHKRHISQANEQISQACFFCFLQVDGMNVLSVREATRFAADYCRSGKVKEK